ncbi:MAG: thioredoxin family protein [Cyclobacteriaceae bacterium]
MSTTETVMISKEKLGKALTYPDYRALMDHLVENKGSTGPNQGEDMIYYTSLNHQRMKRLDKKIEITATLEEAIRKIDRPQTWVVLTESWCGDAAQNVPVIDKLATLNSHVELKLFLRDDNLDIMDNYLTNGGRSIPKLIIFDKITMEELATWGPRPAALQEIYDAWRNDPDKVPYKEFNVTLQKWYAKDKSFAMQEELTALINSIVV